MTARRACQLQVDCASVTFIDCAGLVALTGAADLARLRKVPFVVTNPSPAVRYLLDVVGLLGG
jgi:anti-anti-sigma factor